jgi:uncharacterized membrane protein YeaQ/YmgE (transglycosylase-associated protein family)
MSGNLFAWIAIGLGASLAAMIWPAPRGAKGVALNVGAGILGAVVFGWIGHAILSARDRSASYLFAAVGALLALAMAHMIIFHGPKELSERLQGPVNTGRR